MKSLFTIIFILFSQLVSAQQNSSLSLTNSNNQSEWTPIDFINNDVRKIEKYSYEIKKNGKVKKRDSTLLNRRELDHSNNKISGINNYLVVVSHSFSYLIWNRYTEFFNSNNLLTKITTEPIDIEKKKEKGLTIYNINKTLKTFEYNDQNDLIREEHSILRDYYSISKNNKDTFHLKSINRPKIYRYVYNNDYLKIKQFLKVDSTRYLKTKSYNPLNHENAIKCSNCISDYLNYEWFYNNSNQVEKSIFYTKDNSTQIIRTYSYDKEGRLVNEVDSTGWHIMSVEPYIKSIKTVEYDDNSIVEVNVFFHKPKELGSLSKKAKTFDSQNRLIKSCEIIRNSEEECTSYSYLLNSNLIEKKVTYYPNGNRNIVRFIYNESNLLEEIRTFQNEQLIELTKYFYYN